MKTVCSFCDTIISLGIPADDRVTHGVCKSCYTQILSNPRFNIRKFLNMLDAPVFLVDDNVTVLAANTLAISLSQKPAGTIQGELAGKVLECVNAFVEGGCGKTEFCPDCPVRASVNETFATGRPITRRPGTLCRRTGNTTDKLDLFVTTRKDGDIVLLRLEPAGTS